MSPFYTYVYYIWIKIADCVPVYIGIFIAVVGISATE